MVTGAGSNAVIEANVWDCGSAITLSGEEEAEQWLRQYPDAVKEVDPLPTSIQRVRGVGALNRVQKWITFRLRLGGAIVLFTDVPVIRGHRGLILGNDLIGVGRALHDNTPQGCFDGAIVLRDRKGRAISMPIPLSHHAPEARTSSVSTEVAIDVHWTGAEAFTEPAASPPRYAAESHWSGATVDANSADVPMATKASTVTPEAERLIKEIEPIAYAPQRLRIEPWSQADIRLRVPAAAVNKGPLALLPLEDARLQDLHVLVSPGLTEPDSEGYVTGRVINLRPDRPVEIPKLAAIARFVVNPKRVNADLEYSVEEILQKIHIRDGIGDRDLDKIRGMLEGRRRLFRSKLGYVHGAKMEISLPKVESGEAAPPADRNRVRPPAEEKALRKEVDKQIKAGLLEPANSPFNAIPMLIRKPGVDEEGNPLYRVVIDYRKVNLLTERCTYPLPNLKQNLSALGKANWFSTLDLLQGFHQVELTPHGLTRAATAFGTPWGQYQYTRAPMGLTSSPSTFVQLVDSALRGLPPGIAVAYVDDVIIPTCGTFDEHLRDVGLVFDRLIEAGFAVRCDKVHLGMKEVPYLGFLVGAYGTRPLTSKTDPITALTVEDLGVDASAAAHFAGMLGFYADFIPCLRENLRQFDKLKTANADAKAIMTSLKFKAAFAVLKQQLAQATALARPDFSKRFYIDVDAASSSGIGACLCQYDDNGSIRPLAFWSRRFATEERRYGVRDQECLGLSDALTQWRQYVLGSPVTVRSDHKSLKWLMSTAHPDGSRVAGWALKAQGFDLTIEWVPGKAHIAPDFISRYIKSATGGETGGTVAEHDPFERPSIEDRVDANLEADAGCTTIESKSMYDQYDEALAQLHERTTHVFKERAAETDLSTGSTGPIIDSLYAEVTGVSLNQQTAVTAAVEGEITRASQAFVFAFEPNVNTPPKLLVVDRIADDYLTFVPGGKAEHFDGSPLNTCRRELYEETGFVPPFGSIYCSTLGIQTGHYKGNYELHDFAIVVDSTACGQFYNKEPNKHANLRWIDVTQLATVDANSTLDRLFERTRAALTAVSNPITMQSLVFKSATAPITFNMGIRKRLRQFVSKLQRRAAMRLRANRLAQRRATRVAVAIIRNAPAGIEVMVEQHSEGTICLPSSSRPVGVGQVLGSYRAQITHRMQRMYDRQSFDRIEPVLKAASSHHMRVTEQNPNASTHYFVVVVASTFQLPTGHFEGHTAFRQMLTCLDQLSEYDDVDFVSLLERQQRSGSNSWRGSFKGMRRALQGTAQVATVCCLPSTKELAPTIVEAPYGPALCSETAHGARAAAEMYVRLSKHPGLPLSIDLEGRLGGAYGHIALLQAAVDAVDEQEDQLVYVFDTHKNTGLLEVDGVGSLRSLLEDPNIPKVLHCCYGDTSSLYHEYGIHVRNILDTGLADCMLQRFQTNKARGLAVVLKDWLGDVTLTHKGQITFEENIFLRRPIHPHLFVYAYEDVVFCGALYQRQVQELRKEGIHELACTLSQQRCPPDHLPKIHPAHRAPTRAVFCLVDPNSVICIREPDTGTLYLPSSPLLPAKASGPESTWKRRISAAWERVMGVPPKGGGVRQAIRAHMQKGFRVGDALVFQAVIPDCVAIIGALANASDADHASVLETTASSLPPMVVVRPRINNSRNWGRVAQSHLPMFQYLHLTSLSKSGKAVTAITPLPDTDAQQIDKEAAVNVVLGRTLDGRRGGIVAHDNRHVFVVVASSGDYTFPSHPIEIGSSARVAAEKGFDMFAGNALRKSSGLSTLPHTQPLAPKSSIVIRQAVSTMVEVYNAPIGNTTYFTCWLPQIHDHRAAFHASRQPDNGFELTRKTAMRYPGADVVPIHLAMTHLGPTDRDAMQLALQARYPVRARIVADAVGISFRLTLRNNGVDASPVYLAQHSEPGDVAQHSELAEGCPNDTGATEQAEDDVAPESFECPECQPLGEDAECDALLMAATFVFYSRLDPVSHGEAAVCNTSAEYAGTPSKDRLTREAIIEAQNSHPGTAQYIEYKQLEGTVPEEHFSRTDIEFTEEASWLSLDNGLLVRRGCQPGHPPRIVLPPALHEAVLRQFHDRNGHLGVHKVLPQILRRFYWGNDRRMQKTVADFIRVCRPCQLAKVPHHRAGEYQIDGVGSCPNDVLGVDHYSVGVESDGYDGTLDFADYFTRGISSNPTQGMPESEDVCWILINNIIRHRGVPRELRCDAANNLISKALQYLYKTMGIRIKIGTAYRHKLVALVERWHATLKQLLAIDRMGVGSDGWYKRLPLLELAFNAANSATTGYSPFFLEHLRHANLPFDAMTCRARAPPDLPEWVQQKLDDLGVVYDASTQALRLKALSAKRQYDLRRDVAIKYKPGDRVLIIEGTYYDKGAVHPKAREVTSGIYKIKRVLPSDRYVLTDLRTRRIRETLSVDRLLPFNESVVPEHEWMCHDADGGGKWPVQAVVDRRRAKAFDRELGTHPQWEYRIRWIGFGPSYDSWRARQYLDSISELVDSYDNKVQSPVTETPIELVPRATDLPPPPASEVALKGRHMRSRPQSLYQQSDNAGVSTETPTESPDTTDRFPETSRVRVRFKDGDSYDGTVTRTFVTRPRKAGVMPQRRIVVHYDDPRWQHETFEHSIDGVDSNITLLSDVRAQRAESRSARLAQQLN